MVTRIFLSFLLIAPFACNALQRQPVAQKQTTIGPKGLLAFSLKLTGDRMDIDKLSKISKADIETIAKISRDDADIYKATLKNSKDILLAERQEGDDGDFFITCVRIVYLPNGTTFRLNIGDKLGEGYFSMLAEMYADALKKLHAAALQKQLKDKVAEQERSKAASESK